MFLTGFYFQVQAIPDRLSPASVYELFTRQLRSQSLERASELKILYKKLNQVSLSPEAKYQELRPYIFDPETRLTAVILLQLQTERGDLRKDFLSQIQKDPQSLSLKLIIAETLGEFRARYKTSLDLESTVTILNWYSELPEAKDRQILLDIIYGTGLQQDLKRSVHLLNMQIFSQIISDVSSADHLGYYASRLLIDLRPSPQLEPLLEQLQRQVRSTAVSEDRKNRSLLIAMARLSPESEPLRNQVEQMISSENPQVRWQGFRVAQELRGSDQFYLNLIHQEISRTPGVSENILEALRLFVGRVSKSDTETMSFFKQILSDRRRSAYYAAAVIHGIQKSQRPLSHPVFTPLLQAIYSSPKANLVEQLFRNQVPDSIKVKLCQQIL